MSLDILNKTKFIAAAMIILVGILGRFFMLKFVGIPNFEIITALTLISAIFLGRIWAIIVPLSIVAITDVTIGNNSVLLFTWSAFAMIGALGWLYKDAKPKNLSAKFEIMGLTGMGIVASVFFFLFTNFGWWLVSNMYPHTIDGLIQCYIMGIPFFKNNLIGNLIFVPVFSIAAIFTRSVLENKTRDLNKILKY